MQVGITQHNLDVKYLYDNRVKLVHLCKRGLDRYNIRDLKYLIQGMEMDFVLHGPASLDCGFDTYLINENDRLRNAALEILEGDLKICHYLGARALVVHLTTYNRYLRERDEVMKTVHNTLDSIEDLSYIYKTPIYIEYTGHDYNFCDPKDFVDILKDRDNIGLAVDIGNLFLACKDHGFDFDSSFEVMAAHAKTVNLWNTKDNEHFKKWGYVPAHWEQDRKDGWIDIKSVIEKLLRVNCDCPITTEVNPDYKDPKYGLEGFNWVKEIAYNIPKSLKAQA